MEHLALGLVLVLLAGAVATGSPSHRRDLGALEDVEMNMAPDSFDDQYRGCSQAMEEELEQLNRTEFTSNSVYAAAWAAASAAWRSRRGREPPAPTLPPAQAVAIMAYTLNSSLFQEFNAAVRSAGGSRTHYLSSFPFKALHYLLSRALQGLRDASPRRCRCAYRGVKGIRFRARLGDAVRFGHFTSASLGNKSALSFGRDTFFTLETCYGVPIKDFSYYPGEDEVLIPPFEVFKVTEAAEKGDAVAIQLRSQGAFSTYNCELVKGDG
ncbi:NARE ribosyltransferase, partial [Urocolius indicus]|nr:NARE ribosyltransferase [Urocolius indicus]